MNRRQLLRKSGIISVGAILTPTALALLQSCQGASRVDWQAQFLSQSDAEFLSELLDTILPATDTPGALDVKVDMFLDKIWAQTLDSEAQAKIKKDLAALQDEIKNKAGESFVLLASDKKTAVLQDLEKTSPKNPPGVWGSTVGNLEPAGFYRSLKTMAIGAYMSSEEVGLNVLNYDPVPQDYKGCIPVSEVGNRWTL